MSDLCSSSSARDRTPGRGRGQNNENNQNYNSIIHCIWFCISAPRFEGPEKQLLKSLIEIYKVNIRSKGPIINETAAKYGGGGHKMASGIKLKDKKDIPKLIEDLDEVSKNYNNE